MNKDKFDKAVEYLTKNPDEIEVLWNEPHLPYGVLFGFVSDVDPYDEGIDSWCGCLTQIKHVPETYSAALNLEESEILNDAIRSDERIPDWTGIRSEHLPIFAQWQRALHKLYDGRLTILECIEEATASS